MQAAMTSDTNYRELSQTSQVKGTVLYKTALPSDISPKLRSPQDTLWLAKDLGVSTTPSVSVIQ